MSTILNALQKSKFEQTDAQLSVPQTTDKLRRWKIAISLALVVIIALLSALLYLLLNPPQENKVTAPIALSTIETPQVADNKSRTISFETQPLPAITIKKAPPQAEKVVPKQTASAVKTSTVQQPEMIVENKETSPNRENDAVSEDLRKRFALALLMTEMEESEATGTSQVTPAQEANDDGSDINEMSSNFQNKVPVIRYDSHMYSSIAADRWIRINGEKLTEGAFDSSGQLELIEIQPQRSIFRFERQSFSVESLIDWKGY